MMITRARSGSSYTSSLLSESPDALGFFELFNKFAHMNIFNQSLTKDVRLPFLEALVPDATERLALLARNNDTVRSALLDAIDGAPSERVADVARHLLNYMGRDRRYTEKVRNCQAFAADMFSFVAGARVIADRRVSS